MSERLDPMYEAEIRERIDRLDDDRVLGESTWLASSVGPKSVLPPEQSHVVEDVLETKSAVIRGSVGVFASKQYAEFTAHARDDIPALLDEIDRLRAALRSATDEVGALDDKVAELSAHHAAASGSTTGDERTPCSFPPCDAEAGEPCDEHEREQAHAEGEHAFCGPECTAGDKQPETAVAETCPHGCTLCEEYEAGESR